MNHRRALFSMFHNSASTNRILINTFKICVIIMYIIGILLGIISIYYYTTFKSKYSSVFLKNVTEHQKHA